MSCLVPHWFCVSCQDVSNGPRKAKSILFVAPEVVSFEMINNILKEFTDDTKETDVAISRRKRYRDGSDIETGASAYPYSSK